MKILKSTIIQRLHWKDGFSFGKITVNVSVMSFLWSANTQKDLCHDLQFAYEDLGLNLAPQRPRTWCYLDDSSLEWRETSLELVSLLLRWMTYNLNELWLGLHTKHVLCNL